MKVIVVGCGRIGSHLSDQLHKKGHKVTVIDQDDSAFDSLPVDFHGRTIKGDVLTRNVLHLAEIEETEALAAVTSSDTLNALVAYIAKTEYQVSRVVAWNYDLSQRPLQEAFGIPVTSSAGSGVQRIEELLSDAPLQPVFISSNANLAIYKLEVPASWDRCPLEELLPDGRIKVLGLSRAGLPMPVSSAQTILAGDSIYLNADPDEIEALHRRLNSQEGRSA
jgi:trk system potassium uptake protein TrkA